MNEKEITSHCQMIVIHITHVYVKQRSEEWHKIRREALIIGSTIDKALGLDTLKAQKEHFYSVICGVSEKQLTNN